MAMSSLLTLTFLLLLVASIEARMLIETQTNTEFIKTSCDVTSYPALCFSSLSSYANKIQTSHMQLALTALSVTLTNAQSTSAAMAQMAKSAKMSLHNKEAMNDCMDTLGDSVDELKQSMETMTHLKGKNIGFQISSVQTWVSAALTDDDTCMEGFRSSGEDVKTEVRSRVMNVVHLTSNALGLVNGLFSTIIHSTP